MIFEFKYYEEFEKLKNETSPTLAGKIKYSIARQILFDIFGYENEHSIESGGLDGCYLFVETDDKIYKFKSYIDWFLDDLKLYPTNVLPKDVLNVFLIKFSKNSRILDKNG